MKPYTIIGSKLILLTCTLLLGASAVAQNRKPNIVLINVDDLGYADVGVYGATLVKTPNIDRLANEGRRFTDFHSASAVCTPSRYALLTGEYPSRKNYWDPIFLKSPLIIDPNTVSIADVLKDAGYNTAIVGKWHLGFGDQIPVDWNKPLKPGPLELGFDYYFGVPVLNSHPPFVYVENHSVVGLVPERDPLVYNQNAETRWFPEKMDMGAIGGGKKAHAHFDDRKVGTTLKDTAIAYIKKQKDNPFFLYFATTNIHHPFTPAPEFIGTSEAGPYGDFIHELDWIVGEIVTTLEDQGLLHNTLLILTSDNGGMLNQGGQKAYRSGHHQNGDLLGFKFDAWEGGHRVPCIVRWPGKVPPGSTSDELLSNVDFLATFAAIVNRPLNSNEGPDSHNMLPAFFKSPKKPIRDFLVLSPNNPKNIAVRKGKWVYIAGQGGGGFSGKKVGDHTFGGPSAFPFTKQKNSDIENGQIKKWAPAGQLYDLKTDISQRTNLYKRHPRLVNELDSLLNEFR